MYNFVSIADEISCEHGHVIKFSKKNDVLFYACSTFRDKKKCSFYYKDGEKVKPHWNKLYKSFKTKTLHHEQKYKYYKKLVLDVDTALYCDNCNMFIEDSEQNHVKKSKCMVLSTVLNNFLQPKNDKHSLAQYMFSQNTLKFLQCIVQDNNYKVLCVGTPSLHNYLYKQTGFINKSFLPDIDARHCHVLKPSQYAHYNMCSNHFYTNKGRLNFEKFINDGQDKSLLIVCDPPFGIMMEIIIHGINALMDSIKTVNENFQIDVILVAPFFMNLKIQKSNPTLKQSEFKVTYENHGKGYDRESKTPIRFFTSISLQRFLNPNILNQENSIYKKCEKCQKLVDKNVVHCNICDNCPPHIAQNKVFKHCQVCDKCRKPQHTPCNAVLKSIYPLKLEKNPKKLKC